MLVSLPRSTASWTWFRMPVVVARIHIVCALCLSTRVIFALSCLHFKFKTILKSLAR